MNPTRTSFVTAAGVTLAALSVVYGSYVRESMDTGGAQPPMNESSPMGYEVSRNQIPEDDFFRGLVWLLEREYVEPITDERKLAVGAVKGMVTSLKDPSSFFMDADEFRAYNNATAGKYEGIGVDLAFDKGHATNGADQMTPAATETLSIPRLKVVAVTPGGPADRAGIKPGDWVESVENHWVLNPGPVEAWRKALHAANPTAKANSSLTPDQLKARQDLLRKTGSALKTKLDSMILPAKARDMLMIGNKGSLKIVWHRGGDLRTTTIARKESQVPIVQANGNTITVRFSNGAAEKLHQAILNKSDITLDLRNNSNGDFQSMIRCLATVAPSGTYGYIHSDKPGKSHKFTVSNGNNKPPRITIFVDESTRGAANIFASALSDRHLAKLSGVAPKDKSVVEVVPLPDGSGYTLVTGEYVTREKPSKKQVAINSNEPPTPVAMRDVDGTVVSANPGGNA